MRHEVGAATALLAVASMMTAARATHDERPPLGHTGGFGEPTCVECHFDNPLRRGAGLSLGGLPERYAPGAVYRLEVTIADTAARAGGFQLAARVAAAPNAGAQAGTLCTASGRVAITEDTTGVQYASHAGAAVADSLRWELIWRAPAEDVGPVVFHVAANAANDDDSPLGDRIVVDALEIRGQESGVRDQGVSGTGCQGMRERVSPSTSTLTPPDP